jgi:DNA-binding LacI/PurR family transcriptional regulator
MKKALTIKEVAKRAGVSTATISRAMNGSGPVSGETRALVDRVIRNSGFRPNNIGRQLKTARTHTIGVLIPSLKNPIFADAVAGIERIAERNGYNVLLASSGYIEDKEFSAVETFLKSRVEGLILTVTNEENSQALDSLTSTGLPFVLMFNPVKPTSFSTVSIDNRSAACALVERLLELGHRRTAMIAGKLTESDRSIERQAGYEDALRKYQLEPTKIIEVGFENSDFVEIITNLNNDPNAPTAYFCSTDILAISVMRALVQIGKHVPNDVSVVGFDGIAIGEFLTPSLSTAVQPAEDMGEWAAQHLIERIDNDHPVANLVLPYRIRPGESWGPPPTKLVLGQTLQIRE